MAYTSLLLSLLAALVAIPAQAQEQPGQWTMNASIPEQNPASSGCVILAQLTETTTPPTLQAMYPICPGGTPVPASPITGATVHWPIAANAADGSGVKSKMVIYGQVVHKADRTDIKMAQAGCVMTVPSDTVQYLLGRSLTWNNGLQQLWDNTGNGFILNKDMSANLPCVKDETLLPEALWLPDPYIAKADDVIWQTPLQLAVPKPPVVETSSSQAVVGIQTPTSSPGPSTSPLSTAVQKTESSSQPSSSASSSTSSSTAVIGGGLVGIQTGSSSSASPTASPVVGTNEATCATATVTERYTTTVTATVQPQRRGRFNLYP